MTYCIGIKLHDGLVFLSDSRTNAGIDHIGTFKKMSVIDSPGERVLVLLAAGNLAITQAVQQRLSDLQPAQDNNSSDERATPGESKPEKYNLWNAPSLFDAARVVGNAIRAVHQEDAAALKSFQIEFNCTFILGGQIKGEPCRLFLIYSAGNFIEATEQNPYFQIGESKYGKPILDRVIQPETSLDEGAKCALISMDSTLRSNLSVGLPLDLLCYHKDQFRVEHYNHITQQTPYLQVLRATWGDRLKQVFAELPNPAWGESGLADMPVPRLKRG